MSPTLNDVFRRPPDIRYRRVGNEWVVIRQRSAEVLVLTEWAGHVLDVLDGSRTLADVASSLESQFESSPETIRTDVIRFAAELESAGLGVPVDSELGR